jgi:rubrerythrin
MDIRKIYEYALQREFEGKRFFEQNAERMNHAVAASTFKALADEENKHIEFIQSLLGAMDNGLPPNSDLGTAMEKEGFFSKRAHTEFLDQTVLEAIVPDLPVLRTAYLIERTRRILRQCSRSAEGPTRQVLEMLKLGTWARSIV